MRACGWVCIRAFVCVGGGVRVCVCVCMRPRACVCTRARVGGCVHVYSRMCSCVHVHTACILAFFTPVHRLQLTGHADDFVFNPVNRSTGGALTSRHNLVALHGFLARAKVLLQPCWKNHMSFDISRFMHYTICRGAGHATITLVLALLLLPQVSCGSRKCND